MGTGNPQNRDNGSGFIPQLTTRDWNEEWRELQKARRASDDSSLWDKKAAKFNKPFGHSSYTRQFLEFSAIKEGESVFDMGCGTGAIAIPLAKEGHRVVAADFSEGMLKRLSAEAQEQDVHGIEEIRLSWEDDWAEHGVLPKSLDVAVASRSIATTDLKSALLKLSSVAKRKCAITVSAGSSPRSDQQILSEIGLQQFIGRDFIYAFMILIDSGFYPEVRYIESIRKDSYESEQEAFDSLKKMVLDASYIVPEEQIDAALGRLRAWVQENLMENPNAGSVNEYGEEEKGLILARPRKIIWAHISWDV